MERYGRGMPIPADGRDATVARVERFCSDHSPDSAAADYRVESTIRGSAITLVERRAPWQPGPSAEWSAVDIAQLRYDERSRSWSLYWQRATGRWLRYDGISSSPDVDVLLAEIDADPSGVFWG
jgi:hypothetical protein